MWLGGGVVVVVTEEKLFEWLCRLEIEQAIDEVKYGRQGKPLKAFRLS